jgi:thiosulfate reductase cytochrome b subunit
MTDTPTELPGTSPLGGRVLVRRHSFLVRITHWINVLCILVLIMSGAQIFNAHSALYIGEKSDFDAPVFALRARNTPTGPVGETHVLGATFDTTGFLGLSTTNGVLEARGFPWWFTIPSYRDLATGRRWHFLFAWVFAINGIIYLVASILSRHVWRDLIPTGGELRGIGRSIWDHMRLRFDHTRRYNVLQQLTYLIVIFVLLPLLVLAGLTMSPGLDTAFPWLVDAFQGRQTARTIHFIAATGIVLFIFIHLVMVLISGVWNNLRSMITGRYAVPAKVDDHVA